MWVGKGDAAFADVIHVNSDALLCGGLSMPADLGDVDFYPNGGTAKQAGCEDENFQLSCSHSRGPVS